MWVFCKMGGGGVWGRVQFLPFLTTLGGPLTVTKSFSIWNSPTRSDPAESGHAGKPNSKGPHDRGPCRWIWTGPPASTSLSLSFLQLSLNVWKRGEEARKGWWEGEVLDLDEGGGR
ncbi:hypothetical protein IE53DRAFT_113505 [Violaceomyces palustris]|uniref:Uncharacterized protein n=1 Tax=Violaceomyces palustris TaxID=1673888 RepID=A0ACD0NWB3_9BASI|nr:hypothetical protein IE53DRAFT_113505 [Violaceomyces palustris]